MLSSLKTILFTKKRLIIEYFVLGILLTLGAMSLALWSKNKEIQLQLANAEHAITQIEQKVTILEYQGEQLKLVTDALKAMRVSDNNAFRKLMEEISPIIKRQAELAMKLDKLGENNESIKNYFNTPVPDDLLKCMRENGDCL